jgi:hypothetical protein
MLTDTIVHGETYAISVTAKDPDGVAMTLEGGWTAACRVCSGKVGGATVVDVTMTIAAGVASGSFDSGAELAVGKYYMDVRITDPAGNDYWSAPCELKVSARNTPASA